MIRLSELKLPLDHAPDDLTHLVRKTLGVAAEHIVRIDLFKRSVDARKADLLRVYIVVDVALSSDALEQSVLQRLAGTPHAGPSPDMAYHLIGQVPANAGPLPPPRPVVVGFGPCGIFAALLLAQMGLRPIVLERGKPVRQRTQDTWGLWRKSVLDPESNVQFGEGGAGTFSDGKLWSQIKDPRYLGRKVMGEFVQAGAPPEILVEAHPHIGTFKLVKVVENMRAQIIALGRRSPFRATGHRHSSGALRARCPGPQAAHPRAVGAGCRHRHAAQELAARTTWCWRWGTARATPSPCCMATVWTMVAKPFSIGFRHRTSAGA